MGVTYLCESVKYLNDEDVRLHRWGYRMYNEDVCEHFGGNLKWDSHVYIYIYKSRNVLCRDFFPVYNSTSVHLILLYPVLKALT